MSTITDLPNLIAALPDHERDLANGLFAIEQSTAQLVVPAAMQPWVIQQFGSLAAVERQQVSIVMNRYSLEAAIYNPLRAKRPAGTAGGDAELERWLAAEWADDSFADPWHATTADLFGRIAGRWCVTASNVAKYGAWHGLVIPHEPHPLQFTAEQLHDYLATALRWVAAVQAHDPAARYPLITWNCLPKSGATIAHAHWQMVVSRTLPFAQVERWQRAAIAYQHEQGRNYLADLVQVHTALGLQFGAGPPTSFVHLTPARNREVVVLSPDLEGEQLERVTTRLYGVLRALIDQLGTRAFNVAIALPALHSTAHAGALPAIVRLGDRGPALTFRADMGAMELYGTPVISDDPFVVAAQLGNCF